MYDDYTAPLFGTKKKAPPVIRRRQNQTKVAGAVLSYFSLPRRPKMTASKPSAKQGTSTIHPAMA